MTYIKRQDLLDLYSLDGLTEEEQQYSVPYAVVRQNILDIPAADVVEVVRCRDCKHSIRWYLYKYRCFLWHETGIDVFCNGFCSYGEDAAKIVSTGDN